MNSKVLIPIIIIIVIGIGVAIGSTYQDSSMSDNSTDPDVIDVLDNDLENDDEGKSFTIELSDSVSATTP